VAGCLSLSVAVAGCLSLSVAVAGCLSRSCLVLKWLKIRPQLLWNANRKPYPSFGMVPFSVTLNDP